jgi:ABC-type multidrug transport system ATPase subunit
MAFLDGGSRTATVRTETPVRLWTLSGADFQALRQRDPTIDTLVKDSARIRELATGRAIFEVEHRNVAALLEGRSELRLGRWHDNDLVFPNLTVSRHHAVIERTGDRFRIRDLGSSSGTFVNGVAVQESDLVDGAEIWLGSERFTFDRREIHRVVEPRGMRLDAFNVVKQVKSGKRLLNGVSLTIQPGEFVALVGGSGAGKTTLLDALSGVRAPTSGVVMYNGRNFYNSLPLYRQSLGYVPQDDIIHTELTVRRTLSYAAKLRLPPDSSEADIKAAVDEVLHALNLTNQADQKVSSLSGGQRKRASIGVELLTRPRIFFLDEPTSGLDPATETQMMRLLRRLAHEGSTIILTTHATKNVRLCDKVVFLAAGGYLAFAGTPARALRYFEAEEFDEIYDRIATEAAPQEWARRFAASEDYKRAVAEQYPATEAATPARPATAGGKKGVARQFGVLLRRNLDLLLARKNDLIGQFAQPIAIVLLMLLVFNSGVFDLDVENPRTALSVLFFLVMSIFAFSVINGLTTICTELPIVRRERMVNLPVVPYVLAKALVFVPIMMFQSALMLALLRLTDRLPAEGFDTYLMMWVTLVLGGCGALALGMVLSSASNDAPQAYQLLPSLFIPNLLFSGLVLPVPAMGIVGKVIANLMIATWTLNTLGTIVDLNSLFANAESPIGAALLQEYGDTFDVNVGLSWLIMTAMTIGPLVVACLILRKRTSTK